MTTVNKVPSPGCKGFSLEVLPSKEALDSAIAENGRCHPKKCWHYVAITAIMRRLDPDENHYVRVDAGHIKLVFKGWRYTADTPLHVKRSLMLFDVGRYSEVHVRTYSLRFRRVSRVAKLTKEQQKQKSAKRAERIARVGKEKTYNLRKRVEGFSGVV